MHKAEQKKLHAQKLLKHVLLNFKWHCKYISDIQLVSLQNTIYNHRYLQTEMEKSVDPYQMTLEEIWSGSTLFSK